MLLLQVGHGLFRLAMLFLQIDEGVPLLVQHLTASHDIGGEFLLGGTGFHACKLPLHTAEVRGHSVNDLVLLGYLGVHQFGRFLGIVYEGVDMRVGIVDTVTQFVLHQELYLYWLAHAFNSVYFEKSCDVLGFLLGGLAAVGSAGFLLDVTWGVAQHHDEGLVVHAVEYVVHAPACRAGYLPHESERAMGTFILGP